MPTLILLTPSFNCLMIISEPIKSPLDILSFEIAHFKFASTGVLSLSRSWPYKHKPASNLNVSLAPKPINLDPLTETYGVGFYLQYLARWPEYFLVAESPAGDLCGYIMGKDIF